MNVRMKIELLAPAMQDTEETDLRTEMFRIASHFEKSFCTGAEQEIVEHLLVLQDQWRQGTGQGEDHVQVASRKKFSLTRRDPAFAGCGLTLRAVAISAAVVRDGGAIPTTGALVEMAAKCGGTTPHN